MKAGYYKDELEDVGWYDDILEAAIDYADENHQIDEPSDMKFEIYVEDDEGVLHEVKMYTEYDPRYEVSSTKKLTN